MKYILEVKVCLLAAAEGQILFVIYSVSLCLFIGESIPLMLFMLSSLLVRRVTMCSLNKYSFEKMPVLLPERSMKNVFLVIGILYLKMEIRG